MLRISLMFSLVWLCSCTITREHVLRSPELQHQAKNTRVYAHAGGQSYQLTDVSLSESSIGFIMDSIFLPERPDFNAYRKKAPAHNELHFFMNERDLVLNRLTINDTTYSSFSPDKINSLLLFTPRQYWRFFSWDIKKAIARTRFLAQHNNRYYRLTLPTFTTDSIAANIVAEHTDPVLESSGARTVIFNMLNLPSESGFIRFPLVDVASMELDFLDVKSSFFAVTGLVVLGSFAFWTIIFTTTELENSDY